MNYIETVSDEVGHY